MTDISNTGSNSDGKYLRIGPDAKERFTLLSDKIQDAPDNQHSPTILVRHDGKEKLLNLPTVLFRQIEANLKDKVIKKGSQLEASNLGKPKGKNYFNFKLELVRK